MDPQPSSRTCFLCGRQNDVSLRMTWYNDTENNQVRSTVTIPEHFNGYPGVVHGGIVAAILDETAGRAVLLDGTDEDLMVTLKLEVRYRRPTPTDEPVTAVGWVLRQTPRRATVAGELRAQDGTVLAQAEAVLARPPAEIVEAWQPELPFWKVYDD